MRAMLSFTICGGLAPWARTDGAGTASASPTAVERMEAARRRLLMIKPSSWNLLLESLGETCGGSSPGSEGYMRFAKIHVYRHGVRWCIETATRRAAAAQNRSDRNLETGT